MAWVYYWLFQHEGPLPKLADIAKQYPRQRIEAYNIHQALASLNRSKRIRWRSGTRSLHRGHQAICIVSSGKVLKTIDCPFDPPGEESS
jgi:hypothetical protein